MKYLTLYCTKKECYYKDISLHLTVLTNKDYGVNILKIDNLTKTLKKYTVLIPNAIYNTFEIQKKNFVLGVKDNEDKQNSSYYNITN
jgi:ribosomal protein L18E